MATNLVSLVMQFLTPDMISRIAAALGIDRGNAQSAIGAAVPALLAGLSGAAQKPGGAQNLVDAVKQQSGVLDGFANMLGGAGQSSLIDQGSTLLKSLLGSQDLSAVVGAVSKFSGLGQNAGSSLLGMLTPLVMGVIGKQIGGRNLDAGSLTGLLASQKDQIAQALPGGFDKLLGGTGLLDSLGGAANSAAAMAGHATNAAAAAAGQAAQAASSAAHMVGAAGQRAADISRSAVPNWTYWAVPLAVVAGLAWYLLGRGAEEATKQASITAQQTTQQAATAAKQATQQAANAVQSVMVGGTDLGKQLDDSLGALRNSLQGITDVESARAAIPRLQDVTMQVDKVSGVLGQLSSDQRKVIGGLITPVMAPLTQLFDKVLVIPGVGEVLKPTIDTLRTKLADISTQSTTVGSGR